MNYRPIHNMTEGQGTMIIVLGMFLTVLGGIGSLSVLYIAYVLWASIQHVQSLAG